MWQRRARQAIAVFLVLFAVVVAHALWRRRPPPPAEPPPTPRDPVATLQTGRGINERFTKDGRLVFSIKCEDNLAYPDGRTRCIGADLMLPDRDGRSIRIASREAEVTGQQGQTIGTARFTGGVRLTTSDGIDIETPEATYDEQGGLLTVPGRVTFSRGRMRGTGGSATYDRNRDVLWLRGQPVITIAPDAEGADALDGRADAVGLARREHYLRLTGRGRIAAGARTIEGDDIVVQLTPDDERVTSVQLRGNSRVTGSQEGGAQAMTARDIDLTYGEDGRTLQRVQLMENAVLQLPPGNGPSGRRVTGRTISIGMALDGSTVTSLAATERVQVDLPAAGEAAARRIRSATLVASGESGAGLQAATFTGDVEYRETRAARGNLPELDRTARARTLTIQTQPGLGALQEADFRGHVHFTDGAELSADAPRGLYLVDRDRLVLSPGDGDPGPLPHMADRRVSVDAQTIDLSISTRSLTAEAGVRSAIRPSAPEEGGGAPSRVPSMLDKERPVNVTAARLEYDGEASRAVYSGGARLWQGDTKIQGETIVLDDRSGNLEARGAVRTEMQLEEVDAATGVRRPVASTGTARDFVYDDAKRVATYTTGARLVGSQGDVAADRLELHLKTGGRELERAEGYGTVVVKEGTRIANGDRLTYTAAIEEYHMTGQPVVVVQNTPPTCRKTTAGSLTFQKAVDKITSRGTGTFPQKTETVACPAGRR